MLKRTFIHIEGIGSKTEQALWENRIETWEDFLVEPSLARHHQKVLDSKKRFNAGELTYFSDRLPSSEVWRLYNDFWEEAAFLDIETTGFSRYYHDVTLIGIYSKNGYKPFILGSNIEEFLNEISKYKLLVTFNGKLFDVPFILAKYPDAKLPQAHIDLRFLLSAMGYKGGLKSVERQVGITRSKEVAEVSGYEAVILWHKYLRGDQAALEKLIQYNLADTKNLKELMDFAYAEKLKELGVDDKGTRKIKSSSVKKRAGVVEIGGEEIKLGKPTGPKISLLDILKNIKKVKGKYPKIAGIDLTGSEKRASGWALLNGPEVETKLLRTDSELIDEIMRTKPDIVSIDSPLSLPKGRKSCSDESPCRRFGISRECERQLKQAGISVFWCLLPSMQGLTARGMKLTKVLRKKGFTVIESFPGAAQDMLDIPRKKASLAELKNGLSGFGITGHYQTDEVSHDEVDAITSALVGYFYLSGDFEALGNEDEDYLIVPSLHRLTGKKKLVDFLADR